MSFITSPLHPAQYEIFIDQIINPGSPHYNLGLTVQITGPLAVLGVIKALEITVSHFDACQLRFDMDDPTPVAYICQLPPPLPFTEIDLSTFTDSESLATEWMQERFNHPFILQKVNCLYEFVLIRLRENHYWFSCRFHHLLTDGFGLKIFIKHFAESYKTLGKESNSIPSPSYQQEAETAWQKHVSEQYQETINFWGGKLSPQTEALITPGKLPSVEGEKISGNYYQNILPDEMNLLDKTIANTDNTLYHLTLAALYIYCAKVYSKSVFTLGTMLHRRLTARQKQIFGMFSGILPLHLQLSEDPTVAEIVAAITEERNISRPYQDVLMVDLATILSKAGAITQPVQVIVNYAPFDFNLDFGNGFCTKVYNIRSEYQQFPLEICWREFPNQPLQLGIHFKLSYFAKEEIPFLAKRILGLLYQFARGANQKLSTLKLIPEEEEQLLQNFSKTLLPSIPNRNLLYLFEEQAKQTPEQPAVVYEGGQLTYHQLNQQANRLAHYLVSKGVTIEKLVPICLDRGPLLLVAIYGILKAGGAYVPLDPEYPKERLEMMLEDTGAALVVTNSVAYQKLAHYGAAEIINLDEIAYDLQNFSPANPLIAIQAHNLAYVMYTSGSTGKPKGVMVEHGNVIALLQWANVFYKTERFHLMYFSTSICFDLSVFEMFYPLSIGKTIRVVDNGLDIMKYLAIHKDCFINTVPVVMQTMLAENADLSNASIIAICGEPVPVPVKDGLSIGTAEVYNLYGPTEATVFSTCFQLHKNLPVLIGRPMTGWQVYIVDKHNRPVPVGVPGEMCIGGAGVARGYYNRLELTDEKFVKDPFTKDGSSRMYKTGDISVWGVDGNLEYIGRLDNQVKIKGYRIDLGEIDANLLQCKEVKQAVVLVLDDRPSGKYLVAYVVPRNGSFDLHALQQTIARRLPAFMVPAQWTVLQHMPLTANGKINRKALPAPENNYELPVENLNPSNQLEIELCEIWKAVFNLPSLGTNQNFFSLGGNSINAVQLVGRTRKIGFTIQPRHIFYYPTIGQLAKFLTLQKNRPIDNLKINEPINTFVSEQKLTGFTYLIKAREGKPGKTPLYIICGAGGNLFTFLQFIEELDSDQPVYIMEYPVNKQSLDTPPWDIITIAGKYLKEILSNDPEGSIALSGHCLGGIIAFEMAKQLDALGKKPLFVMLFDTILRNKHTGNMANVSLVNTLKAKWGEEIKRIIRKIGFQMYLLKNHPLQGAKYKTDAFKKWFAAKFTSSKLSVAMKDVEIYNAVKNGLSLALSQYQILPGNNELHVFYARDKYFFYDIKNNICYNRTQLNQNIKNKWIGYGPTVKLYDIEGEHNTMFHPEFGGKELAIIVQSVLNTCEKKQATKVLTSSEKWY